MKSCPTCRVVYDDDQKACSEVGHDALVTERLGTKFIDNKYRLDTVLDRGGNGTVYRGTHLELRHSLAIKLLRTDIDKADPNGRLRLRREALTACNFDHPNLVRLYDFGTYRVSAGENGQYETHDELYVVMQLIEGRTLKEFLAERGRLSLADALEIAIQIADGLSEIHGHNIVHRDLKPANLMLTYNRLGQLVVKILDFGAIKLVGEAPTPPQLDLTGQMFIGSPLYASPESCTFQPQDARSDIYSLGLILYEMLAGRRPYQANDFFGWLNQHACGVPHPLHGIPGKVAELVMRMLSKRPQDRPESAISVVRTLKELRAWASLDGQVSVNGSTEDGVEEENDVTILSQSGGDGAGNLSAAETDPARARTILAIVVVILSVITSLVLTVSFVTSSLKDDNSNISRTEDQM